MSFSLALASSALLLILPVYSGSGGNATLLQVNGSRVFIPLAIPVVVSLLPILSRRRGVCVGAAIVLCAFCVVGGFSIGLFYVPSAVAMIVAGALSPASSGGGVAAEEFRQEAIPTVKVDFRSAEVTRGGQPVPLSAREFQLLRYLIERRGAVISREQLLQEVWGYQPGLSTRTVDVHMAWLRQKLEEHPKNPQFLLTVRGLGYKFAG